MSKRRVEIIYKSEKLYGMTWVEVHGMINTNDKLTGNHIAICQGMDEDDPSMIYLNDNEVKEMISKLGDAWLFSNKAKEDQLMGRNQ